MWNRDADWANNTAVVKMNQALTNGAIRAGLSNYVVMDMSKSLNGHRICEKTVGLLEEKGLANWQSANAANLTEGFNQIRTTSTLFGPYQLQESLHANYWGQMAMRNCMRQAYNGGAVRGGVCTSSGGLNANGEPNMVLTEASLRSHLGLTSRQPGREGSVRVVVVCGGGRSPRM
jgi:hypothetical protein